MPARPKRKKLDAGSLVREMARERVGAVPASRVIVPKTARKKPKHKKLLDAEASAG